MGKGRVIGLDVDIRPHNRTAIEAHPLFPFITLIEESSVDQATINVVKAQVKPKEKVLVLLDSCHNKKHALAELNAYAPLVSKGSYIVAMDGIMKQVAGAPRTQNDWTWNNPKQAAIEFVQKHQDFVIKEPVFLFTKATFLSESPTDQAGSLNEFAKTGNKTRAAHSMNRETNSPSTITRP